MKTQIKSTRILVSLFAWALTVPLILISPVTRSTTRAQDNRGLRLPNPVVDNGTVNQFPTSSKRFALVIGVDLYADTQVTTLGGSSNDAKALSDALVRYAGFPADQVTLLSSNQPPERQPSRGNILRRLSNLASVVPKDGLLLVSFAGHGMERQGRAFLLPSDAQVSGDVDLLEQTAINVQQVHESIRKTGVGQVLLILDACRNDPVGRADAPNPLTATYTRSFNFDLRNREVQAFATLYATAVGQRAYEYKERKQGYFSWALVEGLKGGAANEKGEVTLAALVKYLQERVPKQVFMDLGSGKEQRPFAEIGGYKADDLVISVASKATVAAAQSPAPVTDSMAVELSFWDTIKTSTNPDDFKAYLQEYPEGKFVLLARNRINSLESAPKPEAPKPEAPPRSVAPVETQTNTGEFAFWEAIKNSSKGDDYREYLAQYPNGTFASLAKNRIYELEVSVEGTTWKGQSPGGDKFYTIRFSKGGQVYFEVITCPLCTNIIFNGAWTQSGKDVRITGQYDVKAVVDGGRMDGVWASGKYKFTVTKSE
jgi:hypothetical protein